MLGSKNSGNSTDYQKEKILPGRKLPAASPKAFDENSDDLCLPVVS
jgi:hypothetical protein